MKLILLASLEDGSSVCSEIFYGFDDLNEFRYLIHNDLDYRIGGLKVMSYDIFASIDGTFGVHELPF